MSGYELKDIRKHDARPHKNLQVGSVAVVPDVVVLSRSNYNSPQDKYRIVFFTFLIHGVGTLMPWNMFINANAYFKDYKLQPNGHDSDSVDLLRKNFLSYLGLASQLPNVIFSGLNLLVDIGTGNMGLRVNLMLIIEAIIFILTIILAIIDTSQWKVMFFYLTMFSVVILNMASGIYQNCIFGTGAKFHSAYTNAILIGCNLSGTFTSVVNILSIWLAPALKESAIYYFVTALFVIFICIVSYNLLPRNNFFIHYDQSDTKSKSSLDHSMDKDVSSKALIVDKSNSDVPKTLRETVDAMVPRPQAQPSFFDGVKNKWAIFLKCWSQCLNVFLVFYVTLALFPAVLADIGRQQSDIFNDKYFSPIACFLTFNLFAMIGNLLSGLTTWPGRKKVWILVVARFLLVPFFLFCNFNSASRNWPVLITNDLAFIAGNIVLATTSGYLSSLCMMFASIDLKQDETPVAGMLAAFFLVLGIFFGVNSSFILTWLVERA